MQRLSVQIALGGWQLGTTHPNLRRGLAYLLAFEWLELGDIFLHTLTQTLRVVP